MHNGTLTDGGREIGFNFNERIKMYGAVSERIKYYPRLGIWKNSTGNVTFDPAKVEAISYNWWVFVKKINGKVIFNGYRYSSSTSAQLSLVRDLLNNLGIKIDVEVNIKNSLDSLSSFSEAADDILREIANCTIYLENPRRKKSKDDWYQKQIKELWNNFKVLKSLGSTVKKSDFKAVLNNARMAEKARLKELTEKRVKRAEVLKQAKQVLASSLEPQKVEV